MTLALHLDLLSPLYCDAPDAELAQEHGVSARQVREARRELDRNVRTVDRAAWLAEVHEVAGRIAALLGDDSPARDVVLTELYLAEHRYKRFLAASKAAKARVDGPSTQPGTPPGTSRRVSASGSEGRPSSRSTSPRRSGCKPSAQGTRQPRSHASVLAGQRPGDSGGIAP